MRKKFPVSRNNCTVCGITFVLKSAQKTFHKSLFLKWLRVHIEREDDCWHDSCFKLSMGLCKKIEV